MLSDSVFEIIDDILQAVKNYNDYSPQYKKRIVLSLSHLYLVLWSLDRLKGEMNSSFDDAKKYASIEFKAVDGELSD